MTFPLLQPDLSVWLDYSQAAHDPTLLRNLSAAGAAGRFLWTASDEGRTVECLEPNGDGFRLRQQIQLEDLFPGMPGENKQAEADIESIDVGNDVLWICGSHCRVRRKPEEKGKVEFGFRDRASRGLLGCARLEENGANIERPGSARPFNESGTLRAVLAENQYIEPFVDLPSKDNGLDIEGICIRDDGLLLGLRGPVIDSIALIIEFPVTEPTRINPGQMITHLVDLDGLGVRDLTKLNSKVIVLAGPVNALNGPFRLYSWKPETSDFVQKPKPLREWEQGGEHPEAICQLEQQGSMGLLVLYDSPSEARIEGARYRADWISAQSLN